MLVAHTQNLILPSALFSCSKKRSSSNKNKIFEIPKRFAKIAQID
jgi:hypothetical protein